MGKTRDTKEATVLEKTRTQTLEDPHAPCSVCGDPHLPISGTESHLLGVRGKLTKKMGTA